MVGDWRFAFGESGGDSLKEDCAKLVWSQEQDEVGWVDFIFGCGG